MPQKGRQYCRVNTSVNIRDDTAMKMADFDHAHAHYHGVGSSSLPVLCGMPPPQARKPNSRKLFHAINRVPISPVRSKTKDAPRTLSAEVMTPDLVAASAVYIAGLNHAIAVGPSSMVINFTQSSLSWEAGYHRYKEGHLGMGRSVSQVEQDEMDFWEQISLIFNVFTQLWRAAVLYYVQQSTSVQPIFIVLLVFDVGVSVVAHMQAPPHAFSTIGCDAVLAFADGTDPKQLKATNITRKWCHLDPKLAPSVSLPINIAQTT
uniref:Transmembrane protein n=1 Tax=Panagrellus redivivus TaxID=6233 RepID=A0A7E4W502_PANRE